MRILIVSDFYKPLIGGAERQMSLIAKYFIMQGYQVCVVTMWHEGLQEYEIDSGVIIRRLKGLTNRVAEHIEAIFRAFLSVNASYSPTTLCNFIQSILNAAKFL